METKQQQNLTRKKVKLYCLAREARETAEEIECMTAYGSNKYNRERINDLNDKLNNLVFDIQYYNNIE